MCNYKQNGRMLFSPSLAHLFSEMNLLVEENELYERSLEIYPRNAELDFMEVSFLFFW